MALPGRCDGHMVAWDSRLVDAPAHRRRLADDALKMAVARGHPPVGCVHHSDHGTQYASLQLGKTMRVAGIVPSMGAIVSPWDNVTMESLMGLVKAECAHARTFESRERVALEIFDHIETFYNRIRTHSAPGYLSLEEFRANQLARGGGPPQRGIASVNEIGVDSDSVGKCARILAVPLRPLIAVAKDDIRFISFDSCSKHINIQMFVKI